MAKIKAKVVSLSQRDCIRQASLIINQLILNRQC